MTATIWIEGKKRVVCRVNGTLYVGMHEARGRYPERVCRMAEEALRDAERREQR